MQPRLSRGLDMAVVIGGSCGVNLRNVPKRGERIFIFAIVFLAASTLCLPVPPTEEVATLYPWWAVRLEIGKILFHELLFMCWLFLYGGGHVLGSLASGGGAAQRAATTLIMLALWCGLVSMTAPLPWQDLGRTLRLMLNAACILAFVRWGRQFGTLPLAAMVLGSLAGTLINLMMSYQYPLVIDGLMRLSGQNTPGVAMGVAIHLAAWWFHFANRTKTKLLIASASLVFAFACAISFSRIGWFAGATGLLVWLYIIYFAQHQCSSRRRQTRMLRTVLTLVFFSMFAFVLTTNTGQAGLGWMFGLVTQKASYEGEGDRQRLMYLYGTMEILEEYPLGVGYSGFFDVWTRTEAFQSQNAPDEPSPTEANPHSTFLWYATTGGVPGGVLSVGVFFSLIGLLWYGLRMVFGRGGVILFFLLAASYLVMGLTVPYLYSNLILIFPAAFVLGLGLALRKNPCSIVATRKLDKSMA